MLDVVIAYIPNAALRNWVEACIPLDLNQPKSLYKLCILRSTTRSLYQGTARRCADAGTTLNGAIYFRTLTFQWQFNAQFVV